MSDVLEGYCVVCVGHSEYTLSLTILTLHVQKPASLSVACCLKN